MDALLTRCVRALAVLVALPAVAQAQAVKLNGPLVQPASGDVVDYVLSPDGARVVYRADELADQAYELFSAPADGSSPAIKLNDPLGAGAAVGGGILNVFGAGGGWDYAVTDSGLVVFLVDQNVNSRDELYSVPLDGSASPVRLNGPNITGSGVRQFRIGPGNERVVYVADEQDGGNVHSAPADGSSAPALLSPGLEAMDVWVSPDGSMAVFTVFVGDVRQRVYSVPTDGSAAPLWIATTAVPSNFGYTYVEDLFISDDATYAVGIHALNDDDAGDLDVIAVPLDGSHAARILTDGGSFSFDGEFRVAFFEAGDVVCVDLDGTNRVEIDIGAASGGSGFTPLFTADGTRIVFPAWQSGQYALFQAPSDGSQSALQISDASAAVLTQGALAGSTVVYSRGTSLFAVPLLGGSPPVLLNPAPFGSETSFKLRPGNLDVVFRSEGGVAGVSQLFTAPLDASSSPRQLSAPQIPAGDVYEFFVAADGEHVVYRADARHNETFELFGAPFAGGSVEAYNGPMALGPVLGDVESFVVTDDERRVVYRADQDLDDVHGLFSTRSDGRGAPLSLTTGLPEDCGVFEGFAVDPAGTRAVFLVANSPGSAAGYLFSTSITQPALPVVIDAPSGLPLYEQALVVDATSTYVLYRKHRVFAGAYDLRSARLDGAGAPLALNPPSGSVTEFRLAPDGSVAFYLSAQDVAGVVELYRVPVDGSGASSKLNTALAGNSDVSAFAVAPGGLHVVYVADATVDEVQELWVVPSDGSAAAVKLNDPLVAGGDVRELVLTPDGATVVYRADQFVDQMFELFSAPLAGGAAVRLTSFASGSVQTDFTTTADSSQVLFRANPNGGLRYELFRVPTDGSASPAQTSGTLVSGGSVAAFALAPDQLRVVYTADERADNVVELMSVPLAGGPSVLLHTMHATGDVTAFDVAADSGHVAYRADANLDEVHELFSVPPDGSGAPKRLSRPLPTGGDVSTDFVALGGGRAAFVAEQEADGVFELFTAFPDHGPKQAPTPTVTHTRVR